MTVFNEFDNGVYFVSEVVFKAEEIVSSTGNNFSREVIKKSILDIYHEISKRRNMITGYIRNHNDWLFNRKPDWMREVWKEINNLEFLKDNLVARL
jgi:hypothetical protein